MEITDEEWRHLLRDQRPERGAAHPRLPAGHDRGRRPACRTSRATRRCGPRRDDPLRHVEDRAALRVPRLRRGGRRHRGDGELRDRRADAHRWHRGVRLRKVDEDLPADEAQREFMRLHRPQSCCGGRSSRRRSRTLSSTCSFPQVFATTAAAVRVDGGYIVLDRRLTLRAGMIRA